MDFRQNRELLRTYFDTVFMLITRLQGGVNCGKSSLMLDQAVMVDCGLVKSVPQKAHKRELPPDGPNATVANGPSFILCSLLASSCTWIPYLANLS